jgi:hypothetical protein
MRITKSLILAISLSVPAFGQDIRQEPEIPDNGGRSQTGTDIEGDLNTINSNNGETVINQGAGAGRQMPASSAISPSLMSSGQQSCLKSMSGGIQMIGFGVSSGKYLQDPECNRRLNAITLSNMGMKVASVSLMCQNAQVWRAMFMSATPCPIIRNGRLLVGKNALLEVKSNPELWIPDYLDDKTFYDQLLAGGNDEVTQDTGESISARYRSTQRDGARQSNNDKSGN